MGPSVGVVAVTLLLRWNQTPKEAKIMVGIPIPSPTPMLIESLLLSELPDVSELPVGVLVSVVVSLSPVGVVVFWDPEVVLLELVGTGPVVADAR